MLMKSIKKNPKRMRVTYDVFGKLEHVEYATGKVIDNEYDDRARYISFEMSDLKALKKIVDGLDKDKRK